MAVPEPRFDLTLTNRLLKIAAFSPDFAAIARVSSPPRRKVTILCIECAQPILAHGFRKP
jgi:hypothetical protein